MSVTSETRDYLRKLSWVQGDCEDCGRHGSVTPYGRDEDGQPIGYVCFIHAKANIADMIGSQFAWIGEEEA